MTIDDASVPERAHDQPAEGGEEQADEAVERSSDRPSDTPEGGTAERAGIVDQQDAAITAVTQSGPPG
jgi:hypothetical protein